MGVEFFYLSAHGHGRQVALDSSTWCKQLNPSGMALMYM